MKEPSSTNIIVDHFKLKRTADLNMDAKIRYEVR